MYHIKQLTTMPKSRIAYIILAIFLGGLGVHNFYAGHISRGVAQLITNMVLGVLSLVTLGIATPLYVGLLAWIIIDICTITKDAQGVDFT